MSERLTEALGPIGDWSFDELREVIPQSWLALRGFGGLPPGLALPLIEGAEKALAERDALRAENERLVIELDAYRDAVRIDAQMDGPKFMGCNVSQLRRAYEITRAALSGEVKTK